MNRRSALKAPARGAAAALWAALLGGCGFPSAQECAGTEDCRGSLVCSFGRCVESRTADGGVAVATEVHCGQHFVADDTCTACAAEACCDEMERCREDDRCAPFLDCFAACDVTTDPECRQRCIEGVVVAEPEHPVARLVQCAESACGSACGGCGAGVIASGACTACIGASESLCGGIAACNDDPDCAIRLTCTVGCAHPRQCLDTCGQFGREAGQDAFFIAANDLVRACAGPCDLGRRLDCVGEFSWGGAVGDTIRITVTVARFALPGRPTVAGVRVRVCAATDPLCEQPLAVGTSDAEGELVLEVPTGRNPAGVAYYLEAVHPEGETLPTIFYPFSPRLLVSFRQDLQLVGEAEVRLLEGVLRQQRDPAAAQVVLRPHDCRTTPAPGVSMALDVGGEAFYLDGAVPSPDLGRTTLSGFGGFINVPVPGGEFTGVEARLTVADERRTIAKRGLLLRPGWVTTAFIVPDER